MTQSTPPNGMEALVAECIGRFEELGEAGVDAVCAEHPEHAEELRRRIRGLSENGLLEGPAEDFPEVLGDFRMIQPLGGGGMGVVYLARQESLARDVALKLIRPSHLYFPGARERFRREVELVAQLQHPAIVPVFTFGEENGLPYFAMERVRGCTLGEAIEELNGSDAEELRASDLARAIGARLQRTTGEAVVERSAPLFNRSWAGSCAEILSTLARALAHAHERGILHRDLKPSNAMLTSDGRVQLFDFGLSTSQETGKLTRTGNVLGSVPYMAPEQINAEELDERTDIYALGVTLYELLTLSQPFAGKGTLAMRDAINAGEVEPPRARNARIPRDLETVCLKAMSVKRGDRYATAGELADDLDRFLARKPVLARRAGPVLIAWRWAQRHPWQTAAVLLRLLVIVGGAAGFAVQRAAANRQLTDALDQTESERARAEANLNRAVEAVQTMLVDVGSEQLESVPGLGPVRARLLDEALVLFDELLEQRPESRSLERRHARLQTEASKVLILLGRTDEAIARSNLAIQTLERLAAENRDEWETLRDLGKAYGQLANIQDREYDEIAAGPTSLLALQHLQAAFDASAGAEPAARQGLATSVALTKSNRALALADLDRDTEARALAREAIAGAEQAISMVPGNAYARYVLATAFGTLANVSDDPSQIVEASEHAIAEMKAALDSRPSPQWETSLAHMHFRRGSALVELDGLDTGRADLDEGYRLLARLVREHPYAEHMRIALMENRYKLARLLPHAERVPYMAEALETIVPLAEHSPDNFGFRLRENLARSGLFWSLVEAGDLERAAESADEMLACSERLLADFPDRFSATQSVFPHIQVAVLDNLRGTVPDLAGLERVIQERSPHDERALRGAGMVFAMRCKQLDEEGENGPERDLVADRALDLLEAAVSEGFADTYLLLEEERWSALHDHPRLRAVIDSLE